MASDNKLLLNAIVGCYSMERRAHQILDLSVGDVASIVMYAPEDVYNDYERQLDEVLDALAYEETHPECGRVVTGLRHGLPHWQKPLKPHPLGGRRV